MPKTLKTLIINPRVKDMTGLTMIEAPSVMNSLFAKVFSAGPDKFYPQLFMEKHARRFLANVETRVVATNSYANKQLNTVQEAMDYLNEIGTKVYGKNWKAKLIKNEVSLSKPSLFGLNLANDELLKAIEEELFDIAKIEVRTSNLKEELETQNQNTQTQENQSKETEN